MGYDYRRLVSDCDALSKKYNTIELFSIGESVMEKKIFCLKTGKGKKKLFLNGAHHGLEYMTAEFLIRFLDGYCDCTENKKTFFGYDAAALSEKVTLYVVPMVNPDGVDIAVNGIDITNPYHRELISLVGIHSFNRVWQANVKGVDINHNYNAGWKAVKEYPSASKYSGKKPESEPETRVITEFVRNEKFDMLISFHSQGEEIYYDFDGMASEKARHIAEKMAEVSGYKVSKPTGSAAFGGCKDWFVKEFSNLGFTVEIGKGKNPLPDDVFDKIYEENSRLILKAICEL